jgi:Tol biopolymer transport system component
MLASAAVATAAVWGLRPETPAPTLRKFALAHPADAAAPTATAIAPDGSALAFVREGTLLVQDFREVDARELASGRDLASPFWSPDGEWIGYGADDALWKIRRPGGGPVRLAPLTNAQRLTSVSGGAWGNDGKIVFSTGNGGLWRVSAQGGDVSVLVPAPEGFSDIHEAGQLPDGAGWLVVLHGKESFDTIAAIFPDGSRRDIVHLPGERLFRPQWSPTGHVLFSRAGAAQGVYAIGVRRGEWQAEGEPFLVAPEYSYPALSREGTLAMIRGSATRDRILALVDRTGNVVRTVGAEGQWSRWPTLSADGTRILAERSDGEDRDLWLVDTVRGTTQRFTDEAGPEYWGTWSADGSEILYANGNGPSAMIRARPASGIGQPRDVVTGWDGIPSPDGRWLVFTRPDTAGAEQNDDLWLLPLGEEGGEPRPFLRTPASERVSFPSPADPFVAYVSDQSGQDEIYLTTYPEVRGHWPVSIGGGEEPRWRGDGRELYYARADTVMVVDVAAVAGQPKLGAPRVLFVRPDADRLSGAVFGAHPSADGQTFAIALQIDSGREEAVSIVVVENWFEEFRER